MQCQVPAESEKQMLERMCEQRGAIQVAEACACLEPIKDFLVEWFKRRFLSDWSWQQHFAAAHTPQNPSEEDAGLVLQSMAAASERASDIENPLVKQVKLLRWNQKQTDEMENGVWMAELS